MIQFSINTDITELSKVFPQNGPDLKLGITPDGDDFIVSLADDEIFAWRRVPKLLSDSSTNPTMFDNFPRSELSALETCVIRFASGSGTFITSNNQIQLPISNDTPRVPHLSRVHMVDMPEMDHFRVLKGRVDLIIANAKGCFSVAGKGMAALTHVPSCDPYHINDRDNCFVPYSIFNRGLRFIQPKSFSVHTAGLALIGENWMVMCRRAEQDTAYDAISLLDNTKENSFQVKIAPQFDLSTVDHHALPEDISAYVVGGGPVMTIKARLASEDFSIAYHITNEHEAKHFSFKIPLQRFVEALLTFGDRCILYPPRDLFSPVGLQKDNSWLWIMPSI
jgi:hypothetical protein